MDQRQMIAQILQALGQRKPGMQQRRPMPQRKPQMQRRGGTNPQPSMRPQGRNPQPRGGNQIPKTPQAPPMVGPDRAPTGGINAKMNPLKRRMHEAMQRRGGWT